MQQLDFWPFPTNGELAPHLFLHDAETESYQDIKQTIQENHIRVVHLFDKFHPYGGRTVAYKPVKHDKSGYPTGKYAYVAVAYCNPQDRYDRKVGQLLAVEMLMDGHCLLMPIYINGTPVRNIKEIFEGVLGEPIPW